MESIVKVNPMKTQIVISEVCKSIANRQLNPGDRLPSLVDLSKSLNVSTSVVYRGLQELVERGMLECQRTRGFFVNSKYKPTANSEPVKESNQNDDMPSAAEGRIYFSVGHHSDIIWKWPCAVYDEIRRKQLNKIREWFECYPFFCAYVEQARIMERYFEEEPEARETFVRAYNEGRFSIMGGYLIPEMNMAGGEILVRNLQLGRRLYREMFGAAPVVACEADAFGMISQLPQILVKSGYKYLSPGRLVGTDFPVNQDFNWEGLDGSAIAVIPWKYNAACNCFGCNWTVVYDAASTLAFTLEGLRSNTETSNLLVHTETEIDDIPEELFALIASNNRKSVGRRIEFGAIDDYARTVTPSALPVFKGEFNPVFTGCYTTRCRIKQYFRKLENSLYGVEMLGALSSTELSLEPAWRLLMLVSFHDALCGCHTHSANVDIMEKMGELEEILQAAQEQCTGNLSGDMLFNPGPSGQHVIVMSAASRASFADLETQRDGDEIYAVATLPAYALVPVKSGTRKYVNGRKSSKAVFETDIYRVDFTGGIPRIVVKATGQIVADEKSGRFGEITIRHESGTMWTEHIETPYCGVERCTEELLEVITGPVFTKVTARGHFQLPERHEFYGFESLSFQKEYYFYQHVDFFTMRIQTDFHGCDTKISVHFPMPEMDVLSARGVYAVPFGSMERAPYFEVKKCYEATLEELPQKSYERASGDYPALGWVDYSDLQKGLAIANRGTVGHQMVNGEIIISLQRSGSMTEDGTLRPEPDSFDNGVNTFEFAFKPHKGCDLNDAISLGERFNHSACMIHGSARKSKVPSVSSIAFSASNIVLSSLRKFGNSWIIRAYECTGEKTLCSLCGSDNAVIEESDLQELTWMRCDGTKILFRPFEVKTFRLK